MYIYYLGWDRVFYRPLSEQEQHHSCTIPAGMTVVPGGIVETTRNEFFRAHFQEQKQAVLTQIQEQKSCFRYLWLEGP